MSTHEVPPRNRAERRLAARTGRKARAAGAALTAGSAALAMGGAWIGTGMQSAGAADTLHVTTTADSGGGSLRDVIGGANAGDTIVFDVTGTITLTSGHITIDDALTITGPGAGALTISGNNASRVFNIPSAAVTISGLTFAHGSSVGSGGAIATDGPLTLTDDVFDDNASGDDAGAVYAVDALTITNSSFTNNETDDWGGAILAYGGGQPLNISGSTFSTNEAGSNGGAVAIAARAATSISGTTFQNNSADQGGAIELYHSSTATVSDSTFSGNVADDAVGGAISAYETGGVAISSSTISGNSAASDGGGLSLYDIDGAASITNSTISGNQADGGGGGVYARYVSGGFDLTGSTITGNQSDRWGGGLYLGNIGDHVTVSSSTISDNTAAAGGGGAQLWGDHEELSVTVTGTTISGNHANGERGGGGGLIQWGVAGPTTVANSTVSGNTATGEGGGLYFYDSGVISVEMSTVTGNTSGQTTGGIFLYTGDDVESAVAGGHHDSPARATGGGAGPDGTGVRPERAAPGERVQAAASIAEAEITGSILWGNSGDDIGSEGFVTFSHDLLGSVAAGIVPTDAGGNITGVDPMLGPLQNNGGPTQTHALLPGSVAKDAGPDPVPDFPGNEFDQRGSGFARVVDGRSDIGAFEVQPPEGPTPEPIVVTPRFTG